MLSGGFEYPDRSCPLDSQHTAEDFDIRLRRYGEGKDDNTSASEI